MFGRLTPVAKNLLIINIVVFIIPALFSIDRISTFLGLHYLNSERFYPFQYFTYMFVHGGFFHLFGNMIGLFVFGPLLESFWGPKRFLIFYLVGGIGAGVIYSAINYVEVNKVETQMENYIADPNPEDFMIFSSEHLGAAALSNSARRMVGNEVETVRDFADVYYDNPGNRTFIELSKSIFRETYESIANIPMVGASGAVFAIIMAFGLLFPNTELYLLFPPMPVKAKYLVLFYGIFTLYNIFQNSPDDNVAHFAHLGGMIFGFIMVKIWGKNRSNFY